MKLKPKQAGALIRHSSFLIPHSSLRCVGWARASPSGRNPLVKMTVQVQLLPDTLRARKASGDAAGFSSRPGGIETHTG